jgi:hypothetical protein
MTEGSPVPGGSNWEGTEEGTLTMVAEQITETARSTWWVQRAITVAWWACMAGLAVNVVVACTLMVTGHPGAFVPSVMLAFGFGSVGYLLGVAIQRLAQTSAQSGSRSPFGSPLDLALVVVLCGGVIVIGALSGGGSSNGTPQPAVTSPSAAPPVAPAAISAAPTVALATPAAPATHEAPPPPPPTTDAAPPPPPPGGPPTHSGYVKPGAFCKVAEIGWIGYSAQGDEYVCRRPSNGTQPHWEIP